MKNHFESRHKYKISHVNLDAEPYHSSPKAPQQTTMVPSGRGAKQPKEPMTLKMAIMILGLVDWSLPEAFC